MGMNGEIEGFCSSPSCVNSDSLRDLFMNLPPFEVVLWWNHYSKLFWMHWFHGNKMTVVSILAPSAWWCHFLALSCLCLLCNLSSQVRYSWRRTGALSGSAQLCTCTLWLEWDQMFSDRSGNDWCLTEIWKATAESLQYSLGVLIIKLLKIPNLLSIGRVLHFKSSEIREPNPKCLLVCCLESLPTNSTIYLLQIN